MKNNLKPLPFELLLDQQTISRRIAELGEKISVDYADRAPVLLGVLKGCVIFLADLVRQIRVPIEVEFLSASSYRKGTTQSDQVSLGQFDFAYLRGRDVIVVEGVVDTGRTVMEILAALAEAEPASIAVATLVDKPASRRVKIDLAYVGFVLGNEFLIGYGLDNTQRYRNLPFIGKVLDKK